MCITLRVIQFLYRKKTLTSKKRHVSPNKQHIDLLPNLRPTNKRTHEDQTILVQTKKSRHRSE